MGSLGALSGIDLPFVDRLGWTLVHSIWQVVLVSSVLACLLALSANARYDVAYAGLVLAAALPILTMLALSIADVANRPFHVSLPCRFFDPIHRPRRPEGSRAAPHPMAYACQYLHIRHSFHVL